MPKIAATPITRWKWATTKYVSWRYRSSEDCPRNGPLRPPDTNNETNPMAYSMGVLKRICPPHKVPSQLKVLMAEGRPIERVSTEKTIAEYGLMPLMKI